MDSSKIKAIIIVIVAALAALYLGIAAATAQMEAIAWVAGLLGLALVLALGKHIWILIPLALAVSGNINALPGSPPPWWGAMAIAATIYAIRFLMRSKDTFQFRLNWLDFAVLLQLFALAQAYLRNPTGLSLFGGDVVGGKPYVIFGFAFLAYAILGATKTELKIVKLTVMGIIAVTLADGALIMASQLIPAVAAMALPLYSGVDFAASQGASGVEVQDSRLTTGKETGNALALAACSFFRPITTLSPLHLGRFIIMGSALTLTLFSGFRSLLLLIFLYFLVGSIIRRRYSDLVIAGLAGILLFSLLIATGLTTKLPYGAQRVLSIFPFVKVEDRIRANAESSTDWRVEMWILALTTDRYITNKVLGDGFGYSAAELQASQDAAFGDKRRSKGLTVQDMMLARGSYHGFHVETIRFTGYLGLILALVGLGIFFRYALSLIRYFQHHREWGYIVYLCMPFLIHPFYLMLVFGSYRAGFPQLLVSAGILKLLDNIRTRELADTYLGQQPGPQKPTFHPVPPPPPNHPWNAGSKFQSSGPGLITFKADT